MSHAGRITARNKTLFGAVLGVLAVTGAAQAQTDLARHFGFDGMRILVVDDGCGPAVVGDFNGNGRPDIAVVNNRKSRIELHYLRATERTEAEQSRQTRANELPPNPWYDRVNISVSHRVQGLQAIDVDGDGQLDIVYAGSNPSELVVLRQESPTSFPVHSRRSVRGLSARQAGLAVADVMGDDRPEIITIAENRLAIFPISARGMIGEPTRVGTPGELAEIYVEDYNGDGMLDVLAVVPENPTPLRLWLQNQDPRRSTKHGLLAAEMRFEMPAVRAVESVRFPGRAEASIAVIERASRRVVFYDLVTRSIESKVEVAVGGRGASAAATGGGIGSAEQQVRAAVWAFTDGSSKDRSVVIADLDGDGLEDMLATDGTSNTVVWYRQSPGIGLGAPESFSAFKKPKTIGVGEWNGRPGPEVFVLSEEEKTVGVSEFDPQTGRLGFPTPLPIRTAGAAPVAMGYADLGDDGGRMLAVIVRDRRDHTLELHRPATANGTGEDNITVIELKGVNRSPQAMLVMDADQDGVPDLLLFTPNEPMVMVRSRNGGGEGEGGAPTYEVLTDKDMPQFGLVQAAGAQNTALLDVDGNGKDELLIADGNFVRACRYDARRGWRVVEQITLTEPGTSLVGISVLNVPASQGAAGQKLIVASDRGNGRLLLIGREPTAGDGAEEDTEVAGGGWQVQARLRLLGFPLGPIFSGSFGGDSQPSVLCIGEDGFGLVRLAGSRFELDPLAAYRSDAEDRTEHFLISGDINGDGYVDVVVLDEADRMCQILTFSSKRNLHPATEFEVFQSKLFTRGRATREGEPRAAMIADLTGNGRKDLMLIVHDRLIVYPQASAAAAAE